MLMNVLLLIALAFADEQAAPMLARDELAVERKIVLEGWSVDQLKRAIDPSMPKAGDKKKTRYVQFYYGADDLIVRSRYTNPDQWDVTIKARDSASPLPKAEGVKAKSKNETDESWLFGESAPSKSTASRSVGVKSTKKNPIEELEPTDLPAKTAAYFPGACAQTPCQIQCGPIEERRWEWEISDDVGYTLSTWTRGDASITELSARGVEDADWIQLLSGLAAQPNPPTSRVQSKTAWATTCTPP